ncbi:MAG: hypothetical protein ACRC18_06840 [Cetobacterium sp.]
MNKWKKFKTWLLGGVTVKDVVEFKGYKVIIKLTNGEIIECYPREYEHNLAGSYTSYFMSDKKDGIAVSDRFYPIHTIKHVDSEVIDSELVCMENDYTGLRGMDYEDILENQDKYKDIIDEYRRMNND